MIAQRAPGTMACRLWPECGCPAGTVQPDCPGLEAVTIPPGERAVRVCVGWPECDCAGDCEGIVLSPLPAERRILFSVLVVIAVAGLGLIWLALR